ncbi:DUF982 domain-containing protein [Phyllobacterium sp. LjRoot231]|uniref:DUF982 domain-containing protein n=1 Tax=Phyllobacterium sp. LjRoot231 TaxID=3342289 RepID=UPI003F503560
MAGLTPSTVGSAADERCGRHPLLMRCRALSVNHKEFDGVESRKSLCCNDPMEDYRAFAPVTVLGRQPGKMIGVNSAYDAAAFILDQWPPERSGPKLETCKEILLKCLAQECSAAIARVAFTEAAREANIYVPPPENEPVRGKPTRWRKAKAWRRA